MVRRWVSFASEDSHLDGNKGNHEQTGHDDPHARPLTQQHRVLQSVDLREVDDAFLVERVADLKQAGPRKREKRLSIQFMEGWVSLQTIEG